MTSIFSLTPDSTTAAVSKAESCKPHPVGDDLVRDFIRVIFLDRFFLHVNPNMLLSRFDSLIFKGSFNNQIKRFCLLIKEELQSFSDLPFCCTEAAGILRYKRECDMCRLNPPNIAPGVRASTFILNSHAATFFTHRLCVTVSRRSR